MTELANYSVPTAPFKDLIESWCKEHGMTLEDLSIRCEFERTTLRKMLQRGQCEFDSMDMIVCRTYGPFLWRASPFREILWQGHPPPDDSKPVKCENVECPSWFSPLGHHQKFCSETCRHRYHYLLKRENKRICLSGDCDKTFFKTNNNHRFCSHRCSLREWQRAGRRKKNAA